MAKLQESGHYAIAGFLFQLIGSGVEALQICSAQKQEDSANDFLILECLGQDAGVVPQEGSDRKPRLIQFKYSSKFEPIVPSDLRKILEGFLKSIQSQNAEIEHVEIELVTNRPYSPESQKWVASIASSPDLENLIQRSSQSKLMNTSKLASAFQRLKRNEQTNEQLRETIKTTCSEFGMLESEIEDRLRQLVGLLFHKAADPHNRIVSPAEILKMLTGFPNPFKLLSDQSVRVRFDAVKEFQRRETSSQVTIPRSVSNAIGRAILEHPFVVVVGDGGCGKSIAASDAVLAGIQNRNSPPGFGLVVRSAEATEDFVMRAVARWRNQGHHEDGQAFAKSMDRLDRAFSRRPLFAVCIDAIDEKGGKARLSPEVEGFISSLIREAISSHEKVGVPRVTIILTCRRIDELQNLTKGFDDAGASPIEVNVTDFDESEICTLSNDLSDGVRTRILSHINLRRTTSGRYERRSARPVWPESLKAVCHPVLWRIFCSMTEQAQHCVLDGNVGLRELAADYIEWFRRKAEIRIPHLQPHQCYSALEAVARQFGGHPERTGKKNEDWISPCIRRADCTPLLAGQLMAEALSAGIIVAEEVGGRSWHWKQAWVCEYLTHSEAPSDEDR